MFITLMQISQMLVGVGITGAAFIYQRDPSCSVVRELIPWCCAMYSTYLYFFCEFFVERFFAKKKNKPSTGKKTNGEAVSAPAAADVKAKDL